MEMISLPLDQLQPHPANSNVMPADLLSKLVAHLARSNRYPPQIVRPVSAGAYQILDGHHRVAALRQLKHSEARCVVWEVDDEEALLLLATLNRLQGQDDPRKRGALVTQLSAFGGLDPGELARQLPERLEQIEHLMSLALPAQAPRPPRDLEDMPVAVHFFLLPVQRRALEKRLRDCGGSREEALLKLAGLTG